MKSHASKACSFFLDKSGLNEIALQEALLDSLSRKSDLTLLVLAFFEILLSEDREFDRE